MTDSKPHNANADFIDDLIAQTGRTRGGHLYIGITAYTLHCGKGRTVSGYDVERMKQRAIMAGIPVIDIRTANHDALIDHIFTRPMIAVACDPTEPDAIHSMALTYQPLAMMAAEYRAIGAEIFNIPDGEVGHETLPVPA